MPIYLGYFPPDLTQIRNKRLRLFFIRLAINKYDMTYINLAINLTNLGLKYPIRIIEFYRENVDHH